MYREETYLPITSAFITSLLEVLTFLTMAQKLPLLLIPSNRPRISPLGFIILMVFFFFRQRIVYNRFKFNELLSNFFLPIWHDALQALPSFGNFLLLLLQFSFLSCHCKSGSKESKTIIM